MKDYKQFVNLLELELQGVNTNPTNAWKENALKYVDGFAAEELRRLVDIETRRKHGAFFTPSELGKKVLTLLNPNFTKDSIVYDPACGASNFLISVVDFVREKGLIGFEKNLYGTDTSSEFIKASRLRLQMNQLVYNETLDKEIYEKNFLQLDGLLQNNFYQSATHIVVNPPFNLLPSNNKLKWAKGNVSAAALFIDKIIEYTKPGVSVLAILPDVLRSGSRYDKWRTLVEKTCIIEKVKLLGQFDKYADVDVFALKLTKRKKEIKVTSASKKWRFNNITSKKTLSDLFEICVGPVVDNRDTHHGESRSYIVSRGLQGWSETNNVNRTRKHEGKSFNSPFVVIKRTSRASDVHRAIATFINIPEPVYVDNHLIILKPKSGKISTCKKALKLLKNKQTDNWLNSQIRCRHLTVKVVSKIPL